MSANGDNNKSQLSNYSLIVITDLNLNKLIYDISYNIDIIYQVDWRFFDIIAASITIIITNANHI